MERDKLESKIVKLLVPYLGKETIANTEVVNTLTDFVEEQLQVSYDEGYSDGQDEGYDEGYDEGQNDAP